MEKTAPTGCYKCGRPGHWSRDCPSAAPDPNSSSTAKPSGTSSFAGGRQTGGVQKPSGERKTRTRPKLTPELLLSDDGLGYVLRHFPRAFKFRGRGHEVSDLGNLISLYSEWHSRLLPYYSFDQFVHKVEQVAATKRVKMCLRELRDRVASGGDPSKLHEPPIVHESPSDEHEANVEPSLRENDVNDVEEDMLAEVFGTATEEQSQMHHDSTTANIVPRRDDVEGVSNQIPSGNNASENRITEEQRARMEASRLKAVERAATRAKLSEAASILS